MTSSAPTLVSLGAYRLLAAEILSGRRVSIRIETTTLMFFDPDTRELLRARPNPLSYDQARKLRGARPAGPPPRPSLEPVTVQRRPSATGVILVAGQKLALGRTHAHTGVTVHVAEHTMTVEFPDGAQRTFTAPPLSPSAAGRPTDPAHPTPMTNRPRAHDPPVTTAQAAQSAGRPLQPPGCCASLTRPPPAALDPGATTDPAPGSTRGRPPLSRFAERYGVSRETVRAWLRRYRREARG